MPNTFCAPLTSFKPSSERPNDGARACTHAIIYAFYCFLLNKSTFGSVPFYCFLLNKSTFGSVPFYCFLLNKPTFGSVPFYCFLLNKPTFGSVPSRAREGGGGLPALDISRSLRRWTVTGAGLEKAAAGCPNLSLAAIP
jgi:hypothetical protein